MLYIMVSFIFLNFNLHYRYIFIKCAFLFLMYAILTNSMGVNQDIVIYLLVV